MYASENGNADIVKMLIDHGALIDNCTKVKDTEVN